MARSGCGQWIKLKSLLSLPLFQDFFSFQFVFSSYYTIVFILCVYIHTAVHMSISMDLWGWILEVKLGFSGLATSTSTH